MYELIATIYGQLSSIRLTDINLFAEFPSKQKLLDKCKLAAVKMAEAWIISSNNIRFEIHIIS